MVKKLLIAVSIIAVVLMVVLSYISGRYLNQAEISAARQQMQQLTTTKDSIDRIIAAKDSAQEQLSLRIKTLESTLDETRNNVDSLETVREVKQLDVRDIRTPKDLMVKIAETFPEMASSDWGVTDVYNKKYDVSIEYLLVPLAFAETFIIDKYNSANYRQQRDSLLMVDSLNRQVSSLQNNVLTLERDKTEAYKFGYNDAFAKYDTLNSKYIDLLQKPPQLDLGWSGFGWAAGSAAVGFIVGSVVK